MGRRTWRGSPCGRAAGYEEEQPDPIGPEVAGGLAVAEAVGVHGASSFTAFRAHDCVRHTHVPHRRTIGQPTDLTGLARQPGRPRVGSHSVGMNVPGKKLPDHGQAEPAAPGGTPGSVARYGRGIRHGGQCLGLKVPTCRLSIGGSFRYCLRCGQKATEATTSIPVREIRSSGTMYTLYALGVDNVYIWTVPKVTRGHPARLGR